VELGDTDVGIATVEAGLGLAEELGLPDLLDRSYGNLAHALMTAGRLEDAAKLVRNPVSGEWITGVRLNGSGQNCSEALTRLGRFEDATELLDRMPERGTSSCVFGPHALRAILALRRGHLDEADAHLVLADQLASAVSTLQGRGISRMLWAELMLERGRADEAYDEIERALADVSATDDHFMRPEMCALGIRALADINDAARARRRDVDVDKLRRLAGTLTEQARRDVDDVTRPGGTSPARVVAFLRQCEAEATRLGSPDGDRWRAAADAWIAASEPWPTTYCQWREAEALMTQPNGRATAAPIVTAAWTRARDMGADSLVTRLELLARRARISLDLDESEPGPSAQRVISDDLGLTAREVEVLDQLARGHTDRQIAEALFISKKTVSVHVSNILRKLDAGNRVDAAEIGQRVGLGR
jgi:DNA-binding CsgD family transcriptional regulator